MQCHKALMDFHSLPLPHSFSLSRSLFCLPHSFALQFLLLFTLGNAMCVCVFLCQCASYFYEHCHFMHAHTHTHRQPHTLLRGVHTHTVCNFGASILIDCQTSIWGNKREEFKALLTYVNRGLCAELKFIHRAANYLENFINEGQLFEPQIKY